MLESGDNSAEYVNVILNGYVERPGHVVLIIKDKGKFSVKRNIMEQQLGPLDHLTLPMPVTLSVVNGAVAEISKCD